MFIPTHIDTADGSTIHVTRVGLEYDLNVRSPLGETIATIRVSQARLYRLVEDAEGVLPGF